MKPFLSRPAHPLAISPLVHGHPILYRCSWGKPCVSLKQVSPVHQVPGPPGELTGEDVLGESAGLSACLSKERSSSTPAAFQIFPAPDSASCWHGTQSFPTLSQAPAADSNLSILGTAILSPELRDMMDSFNPRSPVSSLSHDGCFLLPEHCTSFPLSLKQKCP